MLANQKWYDNNRKRFDAETTVADMTITKCVHKNIKRVSAIEIRCECGAGWTDRRENIDKIYENLTTI